jgi:hypothetical protein
MSENAKKPLSAPCGVDCDGCCGKDDCNGGCFKSGGKVCYIAQTGLEICPIYDCAINKKGYKSCAECAELPCQLFFDWKDPQVSVEDHKKNIEQRVITLKATLA